MSYLPKTETSFPISKFPYTEKAELVLSTTLEVFSLRLYSPPRVMFDPLYATAKVFIYCDS